MLFVGILPVNLAISALRAAADVEGSMAMVVGKREGLWVSVYSISVLYKRLTNHAPLYNWPKLILTLYQYSNYKTQGLWQGVPLSLQ